MGYQVGDVLYATRIAAPPCSLRLLWDDYLHRLLLERQPCRVQEVRVRADESALIEALDSGLVHPSLLEEPRAAAWTRRSSDVPDGTDADSRITVHDLRRHEELTIGLVFLDPLERCYDLLRDLELKHVKLLLRPHAIGLCSG
jgi:hypothetical protein